MPCNHADGGARAALRTTAMAPWSTPNKTRVESVVKSDGATRMLRVHSRAITQQRTHLRSRALALLAVVVRCRGAGCKNGPVSGDVWFLAKQRLDWPWGLSALGGGGRDKGRF